MYIQSHSPSLASQNLKINLISYHFIPIPITKLDMIVLECYAIDILLSTNIDDHKVLPAASASIECLFLTFATWQL